jgi:hypothetical protein
MMDGVPQCHSERSEESRSAPTGGADIAFDVGDAVICGAYMKGNVCATQGKKNQGKIPRSARNDNVA